MVARILFVDHAEEIGGAENSLLMLMCHLDNKSWEPHLTGRNGRFLTTAHQDNIPVYPIELPRLRRSFRFPLDFIKGVRKIAETAHQMNADILHANTIRAALYTSFAARLAKRPFIWHMRDFWLSEGKPDRLWFDTFGKKLLTTFATAVIANSKATADHLPDSKKIKVIHNGIGLEKFNPNLDKRPFRQKFNIPLDAKVVGMVGRLRPWKGQVHFLKMAAQVASENSNAYFLIVGGTTFGVDEEYPNYLKKVTQELGISNRVIFTGQLNDMPQALAAMDIFVHSGDPEPFGLVNIEAMAMKKPVVAFAHGALPEIVIDGETGYLTPPYDIQNLAQRVIDLLHDQELCNKLGENGRLRVEQHFDITHTTQQIMNLFETIQENS